MFCRSLTVRKITSTTWYWTHDGESWRAGHLIRYWIPFFPGSKILIAKQYSKKKDVPWSIFIIKGVILLNSSTNLILNCFNRKLTTKQTYNLLRLFRPNTPKKVFLIKQLEQKKKKNQKGILCWCNVILNFIPILGVFCPENPKTTILP